MKRKRMHKWLSLLLAVVMILSVSPVTVKAAEGLEPDVTNGIFYKDEGSAVMDLRIKDANSINDNVKAAYAWQYDGDLYVALAVKSPTQEGLLTINDMNIDPKNYMDLKENQDMVIVDETSENRETYTTREITEKNNNFYWRVAVVPRQGNLIKLSYTFGGSVGGWEIGEQIFEIVGDLTVNHHYAGIADVTVDMYQSQNLIGGIKPGTHPIRSQKAPSDGDERDDFYRDNYKLSYVMVTRKNQEPVKYYIDGLTKDEANEEVYWLNLETDEKDQESAITVDFYYDAQYHIAHIQNGVNEYTEDLLWKYDEYANNPKVTVDLTKHVTGRDAVTEEEKNKEHFFKGDSGNNELGFLYGGMYEAPGEDGLFDMLLDVNAGVDALHVIPEAGKTYYIKEVPETYLVPKLISMQKDYQVKGAYMLTAIDNHNDYSEAGFDVTVEGSHEQKPVEQLTAYTLIDGVLYNGAKHKYFKVGVNSSYDGEVDGVPSQVFTDLYFVRNDNAAATVGDFVCSSFANGDEDSVNFVGKRVVDGKATTFIPYFVTKDGLKVTGISNRTFKFEKNNAIATPVGDPERVGSIITRVKSAPVSPMMLRSTFLMALDDEETVDEFTITKVCGDTTEEQLVDAGDLTGKISYADVESQLFAGWYKDAELTVPADFSDVQSDMTVYAKYISDAYLTATVEQQKKTR